MGRIKPPGARKHPAQISQLEGEGGARQLFAQKMTAVEPAGPALNHLR